MRRSLSFPCSAAAEELLEGGQGGKRPQNRLASTSTIADTRSLLAATPGEEEALHYFYKFELKVTPCPKRFAHDWVACPFAHAGERAARRDPRLYRIAGVACVEFKQEGKCTLGDACPHAHNGWELWLSEERYHTALCKLGAACTRKYCFFAHTVSELRLPPAPGGQQEQRAQHAQQQATQRAQQQQQQAARTPSGPYACSPALPSWPSPQASSSGSTSSGGAGSSNRPSLHQQPCMRAAAVMQHPQATLVGSSGRPASPGPGGCRAGSAPAVQPPSHPLYPTSGRVSLDSGPGTPRRSQDTGRPFPSSAAVVPPVVCIEGQAVVPSSRLVPAAAHQAPLVLAAAVGELHPGRLTEEQMSEAIHQAVAAELVQGRLGPGDALALLDTLLPALRQLSMQQLSTQQLSMQAQAPAVAAPPAGPPAAPSLAASGHSLVRGPGQLQRASAPAALYTTALWGEGPAQQAWPGPWSVGAGEA